MVTRILNKRPVKITLSAVIILGALACVFTPNYLLFRIGSSFAVHIMLAYLLLGLIFLAMRQPQLTFTSFFCCAGLCLFLKFFSNWDWPNLQTKDPNQPTIRLAHFNITNADQPYETTMTSIIGVDADVLSFQEVTLDWHEYFQELLKDKYPYSTSMVRLDPNGLAIYSKYPIRSVDTFYYDDKPNLNLVIQGDQGKTDFRLISSYATPPLYNQALSLAEHMSLIASQVNKSKLPTFTLGDYNAQPWWDEIRLLTSKGELKDSRSCAAQGLDNLLPIDYILHSKHFNCIDFNNVGNTSYGHLGIWAIFQLNTDNKNAQAALK